MKNIELLILAEVKKYKDYELVEFEKQQNANNVMLNFFRQTIKTSDKTITFVINSFGINREKAFVAYSIN